MDNQPGKSTEKKECFQCGSLEHLRITSKEFPIGIYYQNKKNKALQMGLSQKEAKKAAENSLSEAEKNGFMPEDSLMNNESNEE